MKRALLEAGGWHLHAKRQLPPGRYRLASLMAIDPAVQTRLLGKSPECKDAIRKACEAAGAGGEDYNVVGVIDAVVATWVRAADCLCPHCSRAQLWFFCVQLQCAMKDLVRKFGDKRNFHCPFAASVWDYKKYTGLDMSCMRIICYKVAATHHPSSLHRAPTVPLLQTPLQRKAAKP